MMISSGYGNKAILKKVTKTFLKARLVTNIGAHDLAAMIPPLQGFPMKGGCRRFESCWAQMRWSYSGLVCSLAKAATWVQIPASAYF